MALGLHAPEETRGKMPEKLVINDNYMMTQNVQPTPQTRPTRAQGNTGNPGHKRSNSTAVGNPSSFRPLTSNLGGFDVIEGEEYMQGQKDKNLLLDKVRGIFNSIPITIDEKGYLIQLMHNQDMRDTLTDIISEINQPQ